MKLVVKKVISYFIVMILFLTILLSACSTSTDIPEPTQDTIPATEEPTRVIEEPTATPIPEPTATEEPVVTEAPEEELAIPCTLTFDTDRDGNREIYSMNPDGSDLVNLSNNSGDDRNPSWSPDGTKIAFVSNRDNEQGGGQFIYVMGADGNDVYQLTIENGSEFPDWSNDGNSIVYTAGGDIYVIPADGGEESVNLTNSPEKDTQPKWSPDNSQILWLSGDDNNWNIFLMDADGSNVQQLTEDGKVTEAVWTVDGQIFTHWDNQEAGCTQCLMDADGTNIQYAGGKGEIQKYLPFWTLDGDRVEVASVDEFTNDNEIYLVGEIFPDMFLNLTNNPADDRYPDWPANCGPGPYDNTAAEGNTTQETQALNPEDIVIGYEGDINQQGKDDLLQACNELQIQCVEGNDIPDLVEKGVKAIVSFSNPWKAQGDSPLIYSAIEESGIPVIVLNADSDQAKAINLSTDLISVRAGLEWMFEEMGGQGDFVYYNFGPNNLYQSVIESVLQENPGITATAMPASFENDSITVEGITNLIESDPNLGAIWTDNELSDVLWGVHAVPDDKLPAILCDSKEDIFQSWKGLMDEMSGFKCYSSIKPGGTGYEGIYVAYYLLTGEQINPDELGGEFGNTLLYDYPVVTNENLDEWIAKIGELRTVDYGGFELPPMTPEEIKAKWFVQ